MRILWWDGASWGGRQAESYLGLILPLFVLLLLIGPTKSIGEGNFLPNIMPLRFRTFTWYPFFVHRGTMHVHFIYMLIVDSRGAIILPVTILVIAIAEIYWKLYVPSTSHVIINLVLKLILRWGVILTPFSDGETETKRIKWLAQFIQLLSVQNWQYDRRILMCLKLMYYTPSFLQEQCVKIK